MNNLTGCTLSNYRIDTLLDTGGIWTVYRGHDIQLDRPVAIKVMLPALIQNREFLQRFQQEARAVTRIDPPGTIKVHALKTEGDWLYLKDLLTS